MAGQWWEPYVSIHPGKLIELAQSLGTAKLHAPDWRVPVFPQEDDEHFIEFLGIGNAINFCFTDPQSGAKFAVEWRRRRWEGAFAMWASLMRAHQGGFAFSSEALIALTAADVAQMFRSATDSSALPMIRERTMLLQNTGLVLAKRFGSFTQLFKAYDWDAQRIAEALSIFFPSYGCDRWFHPRTKQQLVFDKRARLFPLMYEGRARASLGALPQLRHVDRIDPIADYEIPRALRYLGVLTYVKTLAHAVDTKMLLAPGSEEELAIRSASISAMTRLLHNVNTVRTKAGTQPVTMVELDYAIWSRGKKSLAPHHLTLTTAY